MKHCNTFKLGFTITELQVAAAISVAIFALAIGLFRLLYSVWNSSTAENDAREMLARVALRIEPTIRNARTVDTANSTSSRIKVVLPSTDANGVTLVPLQDGDTYQFYFSNTSGSVNVAGPILWRAKNGVAEPSWALRNGKGIVNLGTAQVTFTYTPAGNPRLIKATIMSTKTSGTKAITRQFDTDLYLRNRDLP